MPSVRGLLRMPRVCERLRGCRRHPARRGFRRSYRAGRHRHHRRSRCRSRHQGRRYSPGIQHQNRKKRCACHDAPGLCRGSRCHAASWRRLPAAERTRPGLFTPGSPALSGNPPGRFCLPLQRFAGMVRGFKRLRGRTLPVSPISNMPRSCHRPARRKVRRR